MRKVKEQIMMGRIMTKCWRSWQKCLHWYS